MNYVQRHLLPLIVGLIAVVAMTVVVGSVAMRMRAPDHITDEQFERELSRRLDGVMRMGGTTLGAQLDPDLRVVSVVSDGPGDAAGLQVDDQIVAINGDAVETIGEARTHLGAVPQSSAYTLTVSRQGAIVDLKVEKGSAMAGFRGLFRRVTERAPSFDRGREAPRPPDEARPPPPSPVVPRDGVVLGVSLEPVAAGLRVLAVTPDSPAARAGVAPQDVIVSAGGSPTTSVDALRIALGSAGPGGTLALDVMREGERITLTAEFGPRS